ncbi:hypothetical protein BD779DRAFT_1525090 [Infundibulicybe gibba]|nr:hypothetical protein BD779DRAFT_1525090 [Infundibulicybe gibba]
MFLLTLTSVVLVLGLAIAFPHDPMVLQSGPLPPEISHIAHDERAGIYLAYRNDGSFYGAFGPSPEGYLTQRDDGLLEHPFEPPQVEGPKLDSIPDKGNASRCFPLSVVDAKAMRGWSKIEEHANKNLGTGKRRIITNPVDLPDHAAIVCSEDEVVNVEFPGGPHCVDSKVDTYGKIIGTNGTIRLTLMQGYSVSARWIVTKTSVFGVRVTFSTGFRIPTILDFGGSVTTNAEITNTVTSSFDTTTNSMVSQDLWIASPDEETCYAKVDTKSCSMAGKGRLKLTATGWIWFMYAKPTGPSKHREWAVNIDNLLLVDERSSDLKFMGSVKGQARTNYHAVCKKESES